MDDDGNVVRRLCKLLLLLPCSDYDDDDDDSGDVSLSRHLHSLSINLRNTGAHRRTLDWRMVKFEVRVLSCGKV